MKDPFALLAPASVNQTDKPKALPPKKLYWVIASLAALALVFGVGLLLNVRTRVSADVNQVNYQAEVKLTGAPSDVKTGEQISLTLTVTNKGSQAIADPFVLIKGNAVDVSPTISLVKNLSPTDPGYLRKATNEEMSNFSSTGNSGVYWNVGSLGGGQTKSQQIKATLGGSDDLQASVEAKLMRPKQTVYSCGTFGLSQCHQTTGAIEIASQSLDLKMISLAKLKLRAGYNFISLPYIFTAPAAKTFLSSLKDQWAYVYRPSTGEYVNLNKDENASLIKPGVGIWIYDSSGGEYALPKEKVETSISESYNIPLDIGYNMIGNPYPKRLVLSGDKILVRELADDGSATGAIYSLKSAIDAKVLSPVYIISYKYQTDPAGEKDLTKLMEYKIATLGSTIQPFTGMTIKAEKKVNLIFPGREVIAQGDLLTSQEKQQIETWISNNGLNQYGDPAGTVYSGGTPLVDTSNGQTIDRYDYIISKHPDRPWSATSTN